MPPCRTADEISRLHVALRTCVAALGVLATAQAGAQSEPAEVTGALGLTYRKLVEQAPSGATLLSERGPMAMAQLQALRPLAQGGAYGMRVQLMGGDLDYDGQTQSGVPLVTSTGHTELAADLMWRPAAPSAWGEGWLTFGLLANRRVIHSTPIAGGLDEVSTAALLGARWRSNGFTPVPNWVVHVEAEARTSVWHRLDVDFHGLLDKTHFDGARKRMLTLRLLAAPAQSPWEWGLEWSGLWQPSSKAVGVSRGGVPLVGTTVRQPELSTRDVTLRVGRSF